MRHSSSVPQFESWFSSSFYSENSSRTGKKKPESTLKSDVFCGVALVQLVSNWFMMGQFLPQFA